jgi:hypothetical protein
MTAHDAYYRRPSHHNNILSGYTAFFLLYCTCSLLAQNASAAFDTHYIDGLVHGKGIGASSLYVASARLTE